MHPTRRGRMLRGMLGVLRRNPRYRLLWAAQAISMTGDWLNRVAILALLSSLGGVEEAGRVGLLFGVELFVRMMPTVFLGGLAGAVADRLSRRALMIGSDLIRAGVVLGYLLVDEPSEIPLLYLLLILQMGLGIFFQAARSAAIPATVDPADLGRAYELAAVTWSVILCVGALLGGLLAEVIGINGVFLCDAATYLVSASLLARLHLPAHEKAAEPFRWKEVLLFQDLARGVRHARERGVVWAILAKTFWGPAGGYLVLLPILASRHVEVEAMPRPWPGTPASITRRGESAPDSGRCWCGGSGGLRIGPIAPRSPVASASRRWPTRSCPACPDWPVRWLAWWSRTWAEARSGWARDHCCDPVHLGCARWNRQQRTTRPSVGSLLSDQATQTSGALR